MPGYCEPSPPASMATPGPVLETAPEATPRADACSVQSPSRRRASSIEAAASASRWGKWLRPVLAVKQTSARSCRGCSAR